MNTFHIFIRFVLLTCLPASLLVMMNGRVEDINPIDIKSDSHNLHPGFLPANRNLLTVSEDYFPNKKVLLPMPDALSTNSDLDEDASLWNVYTDGLGNPTWALNNVSNPSLDGHSLHCAITGGDIYSNVHCYRNLTADPTSNFFTMSLSFYYQPVSSFNNAGGNSIVQGLEFTTSKWDQGLRYEWALQWDNVDDGAPKWRYWDPAHSPKWVDLGISGSIAGGQWHTLTLEGEILEGKVHYRHFIFDQQDYPLNIPLVAPAITPNEPDRLAVAVQLDGNYAETPYELFTDHVSLAANSIYFADVPSTYWANNYIERLFSAGITGGCSTVPLNYCPDSIVTRAQMAVFLLKGMHGSSYTPPDVGASTGFTDVTTNYWASAWIKQLAAEGITGGCGAGIYCPEATVTRAQMAVFLLKSKHGSNYTSPAATGVFTDVPVGYWADKWIEQLAVEGVTSGCGVGIYCPDADMTRAQMAVFLVKAFDLP